MVVWRFSRHAPRRTEKNHVWSITSAPSVSTGTTRKTQDAQQRKEMLARTPDMLFRAIGIAAASVGVTLAELANVYATPAASSSTGGYTVAQITSAYSASNIKLNGVTGTEPARRSPSSMPTTTQILRAIWRSLALQWDHRIGDSYGRQPNRQYNQSAQQQCRLGAGDCIGR